MTIYLNTKTLEYPLSEYDIRLQYPEVSFPEAFSPPDGFTRVTPSEQPTIDGLTQTLREDFPIEVSGEWHQRWSVVQLDLQVASENVRNRRQALLQSSDWTQIPDSPVDKDAWATYRQALRDLTSQPGFPYSVVWPQTPL